MKILTYSQVEMMIVPIFRVKMRNGINVNKN